MTDRKKDRKREIKKSLSDVFLTDYPSLQSNLAYVVGPEQIKSQQEKSRQRSLQPHC